MASPKSVSTSLLAAVVVTLGCQFAAVAQTQRENLPEPPAAQATLRAVEGQLRHLYSVPFTVDRSILATVTGLVDPRVARTTTGGELEVTYPAGVPYPQGTGSVTVLPTADPARRLAFDPLAAPPGLPERQGRTLVTSHRIAVHPNQYLVVWRDVPMGEHSVVLFDASTPQAPERVMARTPAKIIGVGWWPSTLAADYYVTVWTMAEIGSDHDGQGRVVAEAYIWRAAGS